MSAESWPAPCFSHGRSSFARNPLWKQSACRPSGPSCGLHLQFPPAPPAGDLQGCSVHPRTMRPGTISAQFVGRPLPEFAALKIVVPPALRSCRPGMLIGARKVGNPGRKGRAPASRLAARARLRLRAPPDGYPHPPRAGESVRNRRAGKGASRSGRLHR
jgi:hypothetical protein